MRARHHHILGIAVLGVLCASLAVHAASDPTFTYQGQLKLEGEPFAGPMDLRFALCSTETGGYELEVVVLSEVPVVDGLFTVDLNLGSEFFDGEPRWLEISVPGVFSDDWVPLSPRQAIRPAPYAIFAFDAPDGGGGSCLWSESGSDVYYNSGDVGVGTSGPSYPLHVVASGSRAVYAQNTAASGVSYGMYTRASSTSGRGIYAEATADSGLVYGVEGYVASPAGYALYGFNEADAGNAYAVAGDTISPDGIAIYGYSSSSSGSGTTIGVKGRINNSSGAALYGEATATSGTANGVFAETAAPEGSGVFGQALSGSGDNEGVMGVSWSGWGKGVMGYNGSSSSTAIGVLGRTSGGTGVRGEATSTSAYNMGVSGQTSSDNGTGVNGYAPAGGKGVTGYSGDDDYGYLGWNGGGVYGRSVDGYGVRGYSTNDWGVYGVIPNGSTEAGVVGSIILDNGGTLWQSNSGVSGGCQDGQGVAGRSIEGVGVFGEQTTSGNFGRLGTSSEGVYGQTGNASNYGVHGKTTANSSTSNGVYGEATGGTYGFGVRGSASNTTGAGVYGYNGGSGFAGDFYSASGTAGRFQNHYGDCVTINHNGEYITDSAALSIYSTGDEEPIGIELSMDADFGRLATFDLNGATGYFATAFLISADNSGNVVEILGEDTSSEQDVLRVQSDGYGSAIYGYNSRNNRDDPAVHGYHVSSTSNWGVGVKGEGGYKGVEGRAIGGDGTGTKYGVYGYATSGTNLYAGYFAGNLHCTGTMSKGGGSFKIDHPLDPENKYLYHSFVESPDMMNIYNGNIVLDGSGEAVVTMPEWFEALNREFRYQLTCIGGFAQVYIADEIEGNHFKIAGGTPGLKVSWQVTGVRHDPFAEAHRVQVEVDKPESEVGTYLHPEEWGVSTDLQLDRVLEAQAAARADAEVSGD